MASLDTDSNPSSSCSEEQRILATFTQRLIEIAADSGARGTTTSCTAVLTAVRLPAVGLDGYGFVVDANTGAEGVFDDNIKIKDRRLFVRDPDSRAHLNKAVDRLKNLPQLDPSVAEPIIVPREDK